MNLGMSALSKRERQKLNPLEEANLFFGVARFSGTTLPPFAGMSAKNPKQYVLIVKPIQQLIWMKGEIIENWRHDETRWTGLLKK